MKFEKPSPEQVLTARQAVDEEDALLDAGWLRLSAFGGARWWRSGLPAEGVSRAEAVRLTKSG